MTWSLGPQSKEQSLTQCHTQGGCLFDFCCCCSFSVITQRHSKLQAIPWQTLLLFLHCLFPIPALAQRPSELSSIPWLSAISSSQGQSCSSKCCNYKTKNPPATEPPRQSHTLLPGGAAPTMVPLFCSLISAQGHPHLPHSREKSESSSSIDSQERRKHLYKTCSFFLDKGRQSSASASKPKP